MLYYTINAPPGEEWTRVDSWPNLPRRDLFLGASRQLVSTKPADAARQVLTPGGARWFDGSYSPLNRWWTGSFEQTNANSLLFATAAFAQPSEITGTVTASLWIEADQPDVDVFAMLQDVAPDGSATYVTDGRLRASWRATQALAWPGATRTWHRGYTSDIEPLRNGEPTRLTFDFFPTSYRVPAGHQLRLAVTTGIGKDYQSPPLVDGRPVTLTVLTGGQYASSLSIPIVER